MKYTVPNWAQSLLAKASGLDPAGVAVEMENDALIIFLQYMPHKRIMVSKKDGHALCMDETVAVKHTEQLTGQLKLPQ